MESFCSGKNILVLIKLGSLEIWYIRYGHLQYKFIPNLKHLVYGIPNIKEDREGVYKGCSLGKHTRKPFSNNETRSKEILDLIHSDMCGPMHDKSLGGHLYYVTIIMITLERHGSTFSRNRMNYLINSRILDMKWKP